MAAKGSTGLFVSYTKFRIGPLAAMGSLNCLMTGIGRHLLYAITGVRGLLKTSKQL